MQCFVAGRLQFPSTSSNTSPSRKTRGRPWSTPASMDNDVEPTPRRFLTRSQTFAPQATSRPQPKKPSSEPSPARLYQRLAAIPTDGDDPESVVEVLVIAFGANERYYACWRNRGGEYRQDSYDLPERLQAWLFPADGSTRDFASLQVILGHGDEFFASDKDGGISWVDPDMRPKTPVVPNMSLSRTKTASRRRSTTLSSISNSRPLSGDWGSPVVPPQVPTMPTAATLISARQAQDVPYIGPPVPRRRGSMSRRERPLSQVSFANSISESEESDRRSIDTNITIPSPTRDKCACPHCHHHNSDFSLVRQPRSSYVDSSVQTDPIPEAEPRYEDYLVRATKPVYMGMMHNYFNSGSYQLGDFFAQTYHGWIREEERTAAKVRRVTI